MKTRMTKRERLLAAIKREEPDMVPISPSYYHWVLDYSGCGCWMHYLKAAEEFDFDPIIEMVSHQLYSGKTPNYIFYHYGTYEDLPNVNVKLEIDDKGDYLIVKRKFETPAGPLSNIDRIGKPGRNYGNSPWPHHIENLIKEPEDLDRIQYLMPKPKNEDIIDVIEVDKMIGEKGITTLRQQWGADQMFADAFGLSNAMILYHDNFDLIKKALRIFNDFQRDYIKLGLEAGIKLVTEGWFNFSISAGWSPEQWRILVKPLLKENVKLVHSYNAYYRMYDDGKWMPIISDAVECEVDVVHTLAPPPLGDADLKEIKRIAGNKVCLEGGIDMVSTILYGSPEKVRNAVKDAIDAAAAKGGFILGTADSIRGESPLENVKAFIKAGRDFGKYPIQN